MLIWCSIIIIVNAENSCIFFIFKLHLFKLKFFFSVTFDQFNRFLLNKNVNFFKKNLTDPKLLNGSVYRL